MTEKSPFSDEQAELIFGLLDGLKTQIGPQKKEHFVSHRDSPPADETSRKPAPHAITTTHPAASHMVAFMG